MFKKQWQRHLEMKNKNINKHKVTFRVHDKETVDNIYCRGELVYDEVIEGNVCNKCDYDGVK